MKRFIAATLLIALQACDSEPGNSVSGKLQVRQTPIPLEPTTLSGVRLLGAMTLNADHSAFGGFSGLLITDGRLVSVTDKGWWLDAKLTPTETGVELTEATLIQMQDGAGDVFDKQGGDAEGLTQQKGATLVSFERDHRVMTRKGPALLGETLQDRAFERFPTNQGLESLATLPDGRLLAIGEARIDGNHRMFVIGPNDTVTESLLPGDSRHAPTGADLGPDGNLYILFRDYTPLLGVSIIVRRYELEPSGFPDPRTSQDLARFETGSGIDNMEGIALWGDDDGQTRLTLISDDNFNSLQRTILVDMELLD